MEEREGERVESERNRTTIIIVKTEYLGGQGMRGEGRWMGREGTDQPDVIPGRVVCTAWEEEGHEGTREMERSAKRERERENRRKTDPRKGEKVGKGGGRKIGGSTLSFSPFEREREGGGERIYAKVLQSCVARSAVPLCSL